MPASSSISTLSPWARTRRLLWALVVGYRGEDVGTRAGNLTFVTVTSLVPLAAVVLSLVHAFGEARLDRVAKDVFAQLLSPGGEATVRTFLTATSLRAAGTVSTVLLMVSAAALLRNLDAALNEVWQVRRRRPWYASAGLYVGVLLFAPLVLVLAALGGDGLAAVFRWLDLPFSAAYRLLGPVATWAVFVLLYKTVPQARVTWRSALLGGAAAAVTWEVAKSVYNNLASLIFNANMLYGSLGIAPLFLMWVFIGWYIVLSGARLAYALEHIVFHREFSDIQHHPRSDELIAGRVAELVTRAHLAGRAPPTTRELGRTLAMPEQRILDVISALVAARLLERRAGGWAPAADPERLTLADISLAVGGTARLLGAERATGSAVGQFREMARHFSASDEASVEKLKGISWAALAVEPPEGT